MFSLKIRNIARISAFNIYIEYTILYILAMELGKKKKKKKRTQAHRPKRNK
jgi:hypothetical protein